MTSSEQPLTQWLARGRALVLKGDLRGALAVFEQASLVCSDSGDIQLGLAGLLWQTGQAARAETLLRGWLISHGNDAAAVFLLAQVLREKGRLRDVAHVICALFEDRMQDTETVIRAVEMLDGFGRPLEASVICERAIAAGASDPRLHAYAGMLAIQLGQFERVREHYAQALALHGDAVEWNIPLGLAGLQRYRDAHHPDLAFFLDVLQRPALSDETRVGTLFALGKAYDDLGDYAQAAQTFSQANALAQAKHPWSRKLWRRSIEARMAAAPPPSTRTTRPDWTPIFIVGVPRSGTTLLAEQLSRHTGVRNRGELGWMEVVARRWSGATASQPWSLDAAAALYETHLRQDDSPAAWYIDKQPLNLLHVDLILALWPHARIIHCQRAPRDTALSLWMQSFHDRAHDYAYDLDDIAAVIQGCRRLMAHWCKRYLTSIRTVNYEELVAAPERQLAALAAWLELPPLAGDESTQETTPISTASAWQARQPVYTRSAGRWQHYAPYLPALLELPEH